MTPRAPKERKRDVCWTVSFRQLLATSAAMAAVSLFDSSSAQAAVDTWSPTAGTGNWSQAANWGGTVPAAGDSLVFGTETSGATALTNDLTAATSYAGLTFNANASAFTMTGNSITLGGDILDNATNTETINFDLILSAMRNVTVASGGNMMLGGVVSGTTFGLTKLGAGTLTLGGANTYTGPTVISAGTLQLGSAQNGTTSGALGTGAGILTIGGGATLDLNGNNVTTASITANSGTVGTITSATAATISSTGTGSTANLNLAGAASLLFTGGSSNGLAFGTITGTGSLGFQNTGVYRVNGLAGFLGTNGSLLFNGGGQIQTLNGVTLGAGNGVIVKGTGNTWEFQSNTTTNGAFTGSGTLAISQGFAPTFFFAGDMTGFAGTLALGTTGTTSNNSATYAFANSTNVGAGAAILDQQVLLSGNTGSNTLEYTGTGAAVTFNIGDLNTTGTAAGSGTVYLQNQGAANSTVTFNVGGLNLNSTYAGIIRNGTGTAQTTALTKSGTGTWTLSGASTYTGATTVNAGTLNVTGSLGATASVAVNSGAVLSGSGTIGGSVTVAGGSTAATAGTISLVGNAVASDTLRLSTGVTFGGTAGNFSNLNLEVGSSNADKLAINGALTLNAGGVNVTIAPSGVSSGNTYTLATFSGAGTYNGSAFTVGSGTSVDGFTLTNTSLSFGVTGTLNVTAASGGALQLITSGAAAPTTAYWKGTQGATWTANNGTAGNFTTDAAGTTSVSAFPGVTTAVIFASSGATNLTDTLGQTFDIRSLAFQATDAASNPVAAVSIGGANTLIVEAGGITDANVNGVTLQMTTLTPGTDQTWTNSSTAPFNIAAGVTGNAATGSRTLTLANTGSGATTLSGVIADGVGGGNLALVVNNTGSGVTTLSGTNTYSGGTTLTRGVLSSTVTNGFGTGSVTVNPTGATATAADNATLNTTGSIAATAAVTVNSETGDGGLGVGTVNFNGTAPAIGSLSGNGTVVLNNAAGTVLTIGGTNNLSSTFAGVISNGAGTGSLVKAGTGTLTLSGANTYSGGTTNAGGTLQMGNNSAFGTGNYMPSNGVATATTDLNGNTLANTVVNGGNGAVFTNTSTTVANVTTGYTAGGNLSDFTVTGTGNINWSGQILRTAGTGTVSKSGTNTWTLSGAGTGYSGMNYNVTGGTLAFNMPDNSTFSSGSISNSANVAGAAASGITNTIGSAISGTGTFTQGGAGTTILSAANTYGGGTTITAGNLSLTNASSTGTGPVNLSGGVAATLSGTGGSTGMLTVTAGGRLAPGVAIAGNFGNTGTLTLGSTGGLMLTNANADFDLFADNSAGNSDQIVTGAGLIIGTVTFNFSETLGSLATDTPYTLISGATGISGNLAGIATTYTGDFSGTTYYAQYSTDAANDLLVTFSLTPVPEPTTWASCGLGLGGLLWLVKRRKTA